jgi:hypothetical protein
MWWGCVCELGALIFVSKRANDDIDQNTNCFCCTKSLRGPLQSHARQVAYLPGSGPISSRFLFDGLLRLCLYPPLDMKSALCSHFMALGQMRHVRYVAPLECRSTFCEDMEFHDKATVSSKRREVAEVSTPVVPCGSVYMICVGYIVITSEHSLIDKNNL